MISPVFCLSCFAVTLTMALLQSDHFGNNSSYFDDTCQAEKRGGKEPCFVG
jgi:hypothetical protein